MKRKNNVGSPLETLIAKSIGYVSFRPRSSGEIHAYLKKYSARYGQETCDKAYQRLSELGYVNDPEFTRLWIESRMRSRPKGKSLLILELVRKGIDKEDAILAVEGYVSGKSDSYSELSLAKQALGKRLERWKILPKRDRYGKIAAFLLRRGFSSSVISPIVDGMGQTGYNEE